MENTNKCPSLVLVSSEEIRVVLDDDEDMDEFANGDLDRQRPPSRSCSVDMFEDEEQEQEIFNESHCVALPCSQESDVSNCALEEAVNFEIEVAQHDINNGLDPSNIHAGAAEVVATATNQIALSNVQAGATEMDAVDSSYEKSELVDISSDSEEDCKLTTKRTKPKSQIWSQFDTKKKNGHIISNKCNRCGLRVSPKACRMGKHLENCKGIKKPRLPKTIAPATSATHANAPATTVAISRSIKNKQSSIKAFATAIKSKNKNQFDMQLARFIFSTDLSFNVVQSSEFRKFITLLNPAYFPPSHATLGSSILDAVHKEVLCEMELELKGQNVCILQDGWSTKQNAPVISHCITTLNGNYFLGAEDTGTAKKTAEYCFELLEKAINKAESEFGCKVVGVVTDNCSTMQALHRICEEKCRELYIYGCNSHLLNLLGKHFTTPEIQKKVSTVQAFMRNHHYTISALKACGGKQPLLPGSTRWNSQIGSFLNYCENHAKYLEIARKYKTGLTKHESDKLDPVMEILNDSTVYEEIQTLLRILKPICVLLDKLQGSGCSIATATDAWLTLSKVLPASILEDDYFKKQEKLGLTEVGVAAYILHPKYKGKGLPDDLLDVGLKFIGMNHQDENIIAVSAMKSEKSRYFIPAYMNNKICEEMDPLAWWKAAATNAVPKSLKDFAARVFVLPSSTGNIERNFSTLGNIMTKQRNRLSVNKASKLCTIHNFYKLQQEQADAQNGVNPRSAKCRRLELIDESPASGFSAPASSSVIKI